MTNGWVDIKNTDMMLIMGGNPAENHPCGFKWAVEAKRNRNAKMIVVDPRFTRTAAVADMFVQIRAGADIAFLDGLISGFDAATQEYDKASWNYEAGGNLTGKSVPPDANTPAGASNVPAGLPPDTAYDTSLEHPRCVYQLLKKQYSRYTPEIVER